MELSFIGWMLLTTFAVALVSNLLEAMIGAGVVMIVINWILNLAICWVMAYMTATEAAFYEILTGRLRAGTQGAGQF